MLVNVDVGVKVEIVVDVVGVDDADDGTDVDVSVESDVEINFGVIVDAQLGTYSPPHRRPHGTTCHLS